MVCCIELTNFRAIGAVICETLFRTVGIKHCWAQPSMPFFGIMRYIWYDGISYCFTDKNVVKKFYIWEDNNVSEKFHLINCSVIDCLPKVLKD